MAVVIDGSNTPTAGGVVYGDGTEYASTAAGSAGGVLYSAGSSAPAFTAAGTSGQILQSNGASAPSWVAAPGGGSWIYLSTVTASAAATADIESTFDSTYDMYAIIAEDVRVSASTTQVRVRLKIGGAYVLNTYYGLSANLFSNDTTSPYVADSNTGYMNLAQDVASSASSPLAFTMYVPKPASTTTYKSVFMTGGGWRASSTGASYLYLSGGYAGATSALTGVRFYATTGTITGTFRLYGIKNS